MKAPSRISGLPALTRCPGMAVLRAQAYSPSAAAHTGSAVGRVIELWHRGGETGDAFEPALLQAMHQAPAEWPLARWDDVRTWALLYAQDPRNKGGLVDAERQEAEVTLTIDGTTYCGHIDQIRRDPRTGYGEVWDVKSGRASGQAMTHAYALQLAAYALACTQTWGEPVLPGGIIRLRDYEVSRNVSPREFTCSQCGAWPETPCLKRDGEPSTSYHRPRREAAQAAPPPPPARVFYATPWSHDVCWQLVEVAHYTRQEIERGVIRTVPGESCAYCPGGGPGSCGDQIHALIAGGAS